MTEHDSPPPNVAMGTSWPTLGLILLLTVLVVAYVVGRPYFRRKSLGESHHSVGTRLEKMELQPLVNTTQSLSLDDLRDKVVFVNYWGPWCPPCKAEMPHLIEMEESLRDRDDFAFVSISTGIGEAYADAQELQDETDDYARRMSIKFPIYSDPTGESRSTLVEVAELSGFGYPTSVLLGKDRTIRAFWLGYNDGMEDEVNAVVLGVLSAEQSR